MNTTAFLANQKQYFESSYTTFKEFGGPCVHFHFECLRAGQTDFLSNRHLEMLYATLTAWGLHRMGDAEKTKAKLREWQTFRNSLIGQATAFKSFLGLSMLEMPEREYAGIVRQLQTSYASLELSESNATVVVNSKALHHLFPELIPPIDRQYTIRFFTQHSDKWRGTKGAFRQIPLPSCRLAQFELFHKMCMNIKRLADQVDPNLFVEERRRYDVMPPKAIDNAIVNFVRIVSKQSAVFPNNNQI